MIDLGQFQLNSKRVFDYFCEIAAIPHGSGNTKAISDYLVGFAKRHGLWHVQDSLNNVIIIREATAGYEEAEPVILQGHMDMVCEKESGCKIDFERDGLKLYVDGDFLKAEGTTLGGDDGIAVAYMLALLESDAICHPRLEAVITVDEETGMFGAEGIDLSMLRGKRMLNLDSDWEGHFLTSCAGGMKVESVLPVKREEAEGIRVAVEVSGLLGGHSGSEIDKEHANADIVMGRVLREISVQYEIGIYELAGGMKDNAIPRECTAKLLVSEADLAGIEQTVFDLSAGLKKEYASSDPDIRVTLERCGSGTEQVLSLAAQTKILFYLAMVPNGVQHMSKIMPGLVETSLNLGIMRLTGESFETVISVRSSVTSRKEELCGRLTFLVEFLGGGITVNGDYPAWEYRTDSPLREQIESVYSRMYGEKPVFEAIHAGLECGILSDKIADLDCVSFGPTIHDIHTPKERLSIPSTEKIWNFLVEFLRCCK